MGSYTIEYPNKGKSEEEYCSVEHGVDLAIGDGTMYFFIEILLDIGLCFRAFFSKHV